jgi:hypothetical protein
MSGTLSKIWKETHTFFITGGVMSLGDLVSQKLIEKKEDFDVARNARFAALGLFFVVSIPLSYRDNFSAVSEAMS